MNILITPKEQICKELTDIDSFLNITMSKMQKKPYCAEMTWLYMSPVQASY